MESREEFGYRGDRVRMNTRQRTQRRIDRQMQTEVQLHALRDPQAIDERIRELEQEWDIERVLEFNASTLALTGLVFGIVGNKKWLWIPATILPFLLQHAIQGWCPPIPLLRWLGIRTQREIEAEKYALKALQKERELS